MSIKYIGYTSRFAPLKIYETPVPENIGPRQLLINVSDISINPIDIKLKSIALAPVTTYQVGKDFSGSIQRVGGSLGGKWKVGERVCGTLLSPFEGTLGTRAVLDVTKHAITKTPSNLGDAEAAAFPSSFGTAASMFKKSTRKGKLLVTGGATSVGMYAIQLAKLMYDYDEVVAICSARSSEYVKSLGATTTLDYTKGNVSSQLKDLGIRFDAIFDTVGGTDALRVWRDILKTDKEGGVYVSIAGDVAPSGTYKNALIMPTLRSIPTIIPRLLFGRFLGLNYQLATTDSSWTQIASEFFALPQAKVRIDSVYPLKDYEQAWDKVEQMKAHGKVLIAMNPSESVSNEDQN